QLRRHALGRAMAAGGGGLPLRRLAHGDELVDGLVVVARRPAPGRTVQPTAGVLPRPGPRRPPEPVLARRTAPRRRPPHGPGGDERHRLARGRPPAPARFRARPVGPAGADRTVPLLRRDAADDGPAPPLGPLPDLVAARHRAVTTRPRLNKMRQVLATKRIR